MSNEKGSSASPGENHLKDKIKESSEKPKANYEIDFDPESKTHAERHEQGVNERNLKLTKLVEELTAGGRAYVVSTAKILLSTGQQIDDISFETANIVFKNVKVVYAWGIIKRVVLFIVFATLFSTNFIQTYITQAFVSLDINSGNCKYVPKTWTNPLLYLDSNGVWQGLPGFQNQLAAYQFFIYDFLATPQLYNEWLTNVMARVKSTGDNLVKRDLAYSILYWSSWSYSSPITYGGITSTTTIAMAADPISILNNEGLQGTIASVNNDCYLSSSTQSFNSANGLFTTIFSAANLQDPTTPCYNILQPDLLGYDASINGDAFKMNIDSIAIFTALAIANQVNGENTYDQFVTFKEIARSFWPLFPGDPLYSSRQVYVVVDRFDPNYPGSSPITCVGPLNGPNSLFNCALRQGKSYGIPFLQHKGISKALYQPCTCAVNAIDYCDAFDFMFGSIFYDHSAPHDFEGDGYNAWLSSHPDETKGGYSALFLPMIPLLEVFVEPTPVSAMEANSKSAPAAFSSLFGQFCSGTRCIICGSLFTTTSTYTLSTRTTITSITAADYARLNVGMQLVSYQVGNVIYSHAEATSSSFNITGSTTADSSTITLAGGSSIVGVRVGSVISGKTLATITKVTAVYGSSIEISPSASSTGASVILTVVPGPLVILISGLKQNLDSLTYTMTFDTVLSGADSGSSVTALSFACPDKLTSTTANTVYDYTNAAQRAINFKFSTANHYGILHTADTEYLTVIGTTNKTGVEVTNLSMKLYFSSSTAAANTSLTDTEFARRLSSCTVAGGAACKWIVSGSGIHLSDSWTANYSTAFVVAASDSSITLNRAPTTTGASVTLTFTKQEGGYGSMAVYNSFSTFAQSVTINNFQLKDGACSNSLVMPNISRAITRPWGQLVEVYFQCTATLGDAILNSAGIAAGTTGLIVPTFFFTFMFFVMGYTAYNHAVEDLDKRMMRKNTAHADDFVANGEYTTFSKQKHEEMRHMEMYHYSIGQAYEKFERKILSSWQDSDGVVHKKKSTSSLEGGKKSFTSRFFIKKNRTWKMNMEKVTAFDLLDRGSFGDKQDPACKLFLGEEMVGQTKRLVEAGTDADWHEVFEDIEISKHDYLEGICLRVEVFNEHLTGHLTALGVGSVVLNEVIPRDMLEQVCKIWIELTTPEGKQKGVVCIDAYLDGELTDDEPQGPGSGLFSLGGSNSNRF